MKKPSVKSGDVFGRLTVISKSHSQNGNMRWFCECSCGGTATPYGYSLKSGVTKSCGCLSRELSAARLLTHGMRKTPEYHAYNHMISRCNNPNDKGYSYYGGRGITVCAEWLLGFENFINDMGLKPNAQAQLDRIDNNKGYSKENCRWVNKSENMRNRRNNVHISYNGETRLLCDWSEYLNIPYGVLWYRLFVAKWSISRAFNILGRKSKYK